jgi:hypothetical protein
MIPCICQNPENCTSQRVSFNVCKLQEKWFLKALNLYGHIQHLNCFFCAVVCVCTYADFNIPEWKWGVRRQDQEYLFLSLNDPWLLSAPPMLHPSELNVRPEAFFLVLRIVSRALISNMLDKLSITELHFQLLDIFFFNFWFWDNCTFTCGCQK